MFINKLISEIRSKKSPIVVGLDPMLDMIPDFIKEKHFNDYGKNFRAVRKIIIEFNKNIINNIHDIVPAVKPQIAFYEQFGIEGLKAYRDTCEYAKKKGLLVIGDIKRGDIGSTSKAYSNAHLGFTKIDSEEDRGFPVDSITLNPYLGDDCIKEFIQDVKDYDKGMFILVKTSNPTSGQLQDLITEGRSIYEVVAEMVNNWSKDLIGEQGYSSIGAVVGANYPEQAKRLRNLMPSSYFLVPGYGAQGGTAKDVINSFNNDGLGAIVNSSRGILYAYRKMNDSNHREYGEIAREEARNMKGAINKALDRNNKGYW